MTVLQDLMLEINTLKESQRGVQDQIQKLPDTAGVGNLSQMQLKTETEKDIESLQTELELLKARLKILEDKLEVLYEILARRPEIQDAQMPYSLPPGDIISPMSGPAQVTEVSISNGTTLTTSQTTLSQTQGSSQAEESALPVGTTHGVKAGTLEDTPGQMHETDPTYLESSMAQSTGINPSMTSMDTTLAPGSLEVTPVLPAGATSTEHAMLSTRVDALERDKADRAELGLLQINSDDLAKTVPDLQEKLNCLNKEMQDLREDRLEQLQRALDPILTQQIDQKLEDTNQINQQLGHLSATIQDIEKELKELRDRQEKEKATMEQSVADTSLQLQDQLNMLRGILTTMASSSSTLLAMSIPKDSDSSTPVSTTEAELPARCAMPSPDTTTTSEERLTCPACTIDIGKKVSQLVSQYEHLQKVVTDYTSREGDGKDLQVGRKASDPSIQDTEVIGYITNTMVQLQEECEQLTQTTRSLIQDHEQKQQHIDILYQAVGKLENKKADKELIGLEIDVKADKSALERKVSRTQFDATTEHLSRMIQELLGKMSAQEQDWQRLLEKISLEMENKLNRIEIESVKNILEERWQDLRRQLQKHPPQYQADEAAGIRKQLMTRFHCISCDRSVNMMVPGPTTLTIPKIPGLPARHSNRPNTVFELNQVRQQSRRLKSRIYQARCEASQLEMNINHLRRIHAHMCQEIARVQVHFGGSDKTFKNPIVHHCTTLGKTSKMSSSNQRFDGRLPELGSVRSMSSSRSCGGSHTLTSSQRRYMKVVSSCSLQKKDTTECGLTKEEVLVLGQDGHIYRGRTGNHLPTTKPKDGKRELATHHKASGCNLKRKESLYVCSSATSSDIRSGVSKVLVKSPGSEQPLPSIQGTALATYSQKVPSTRRSSALLGRAQGRPFSASRGGLHQQSD
ncbi:glutamine-rich protein 2-like isoform X1 [Bufo bufo]|uniref:glutamine-rich protein 2-like isoform X1 n=1 Tax=Bufo bufo TaxID=8384 RepID=UPI001ABE9BA4|nr:glutamine-rich protein 2-like isoform X1 [Bufo bufo]